MKRILTTIILVSCCFVTYSKGSNAEFVHLYKYDASLKKSDTLSAHLYFKKHSFTASWFVAATGKNITTVNGSWHFSNRAEDFERFNSDTAIYNGLKKRRIRLVLLNYKGQVIYGLFGHMLAQPYFLLQRNADFPSSCSPAAYIPFGPYEPNIPDMRSLSHPPVFIPSKK